MSSFFSVETVLFVILPELQHGGTLGKIFNEGLFENKTHTNKQPPPHPHFPSLLPYSFPYLPFLTFEIGIIRQTEQRSRRSLRRHQQTGPISEGLL